MSHLLAGCRVVEVSALLNGASTTMVLADLGAEVVKVESPFMGDYIRVPSTRYLHGQVNKNKLSVTIDLRKAEGQAVLRRLVATADVFVTNVLARSTERLGISYDQLRAVKADLVYCQVTGFGAVGPLANVPTHGQMMDALAGTLPGEIGPDGLPTAKRPPVIRTGSLSIAGEATSAGAVQAALHIAAALVQRGRTGEGCYLDVAASDAAVASGWAAASAQLNVPPAEQWWTAPDAGLGSARYQHYQTKDERFVMFCPEEAKFWARFCELVSRPDLLDRHFGVELRAEIQQIIATRTRQEWLELAAAHLLPLGPANDGAEEVRNDPQIQSRSLFLDGATEDGRPFVYLADPVLVAGQPYEPPRPAPALGEHTDDVLRELGYSDQDIEGLARAEVTRAAVKTSGYISEQVHSSRA